MLTAKRVIRATKVTPAKRETREIRVKKETKETSEKKATREMPVRTAGVRGIFMPQTAAPALHSISRFSCLKIAIPEDFLCGIEPTEP